MVGIQDLRAGGMNWKGRDRALERLIQASLLLLLYI